MVHPGIHLARIQAERNGAVKAQGGILSEVVIGCGVAAFDCAVLHAVQDSQRRHDLTSGKCTDGELAVGSFRNVFRDILAAAVNSVGTAWKAGRQAPVDGGRLLRECGCCQSGAAGDGTQCSVLQKRTASHEYSLWE